MNLLKKISRFSQKEPYAGGEGKASICFLKLIPENKKKVLVIGCGEGYEVDWLARHGFKALGITKNKKEATSGHKKYGVKIKLADMHDLAFSQKFDAIFAGNVLEHSPAPYLALLHWRNFLTKNGWLILVMPSKKWTAEYYHFSVLTHLQTKDLLYKAGFKLLAGPNFKSKINLNNGDIFYDLGRGWGHYDGYVAEKTAIPKKKFMLGEFQKNKKVNNKLLQLIKVPLKIPYNKVRVWHARHHRD